MALVKALSNFLFLAALTIGTPRVCRGGSRYRHHIVYRDENRDYRVVASSRSRVMSPTKFPPS